MTPLGKERSRTGRFRSIGTVAAVAVLSLALGAWASFEVFTGIEAEASPGADYLLAEAVEGTVSDSLQLNVSAEWKAETSIANPASGMVTETVHAAGETVETGDVLYTVDLKPVVAAEGAVPAFRAMAQGDKGADVAQLQQFLIDEGHYGGDADGKFDYRLHWAVRAWQKDLGLDPTGSVPLGAVLFAPELPARASLGKDIKVGTSVSGSSAAIDLLPDGPEFSITMQEAQGRTTQVGMEVQIAADDGTWTARIAEMREGEGDQVIAVLESVGDEPVCGDACPSIPIGTPTLLSSSIILVPETTGVSVPVAALATDSSGQAMLTTEDGEAVPVQILAAADGVAVVEGVDLGTRVRISGGDR